MSTLSSAPPPKPRCKWSRTTWWSDLAAAPPRPSRARRQREGLRFVGIPTSERTAMQAKAAGIALTSFSEHRQIDLTIDGADEVEHGTLNLIKGGGGALLREKIVAAASHRLAIVVDGGKMVDRLGTHTAVPVEVVAF